MRLDTIAQVLRAYHIQGWSIKKIAQGLHVSRNTVRKILRTDKTDFTDERDQQRPKPMFRIPPNRMRPTSSTGAMRLL